jgi:ubiquinone/menaquinone biosynthesis C-methylase UbiE
MSTTGTIFSGSGDAYDRFMGRYSTQLAPAFADFAGVGAGMRVLDVGAGTGALTQELVARVGEANVAAAEPSPDYAAVLRDRFPGLEIEQAPAAQLPWEDAAFDATLAQLVVVFVEDAPAAFRELARVTKPGGVVATTMWAVEGMDMMNALNEVRRQLRPGAFTPSTQYRDEASLRELFEQCELQDVETTTLEVSVEYASVDELWEPAIHVGGPGGPVAEALRADDLARGRAIFEEALGKPAGTFRLAGRSATVRGTKS